MRCDLGIREDASPRSARSATSTSPTACTPTTDTLNEVGYLQSTLSAIDGRTIHAYRTEGASEGHAPDIINGIYVVLR